MFWRDNDPKNALESDLKSSLFVLCAFELSGGAIMLFKRCFKAKLKAIEQTCANCKINPQFGCYYILPIKDGNYSTFIKCDCGFRIDDPREFSTCKINAKNVDSIELTKEHVVLMIEDWVHFSKLLSSNAKGAMKHTQKCTEEDDIDGDDFDELTMEMKPDYCGDCKMLTDDIDKHNLTCHPSRIDEEKDTNKYIQFEITRA